MSNQMTLQPTEFIKKRGETVISRSFGFCLSDFLDSIYSNRMTAEEFAEVSAEDLSFLKHIVDNYNHGKIEEMLYSLVENEKGLEINGTWYDWEEIKDILE